MKIQLELIKMVLDRFSNTVYPDDTTYVTIPVLGNFNDLDYSSEIKTTEFHFQRDGKEWFLIGIN